MLPFIVSPIATLQAMGCPIIIGSPSNQRGPGQLLTVGSSLYFIVRSQMGTTPSDAILVYKSVNITTWNLVATLPFSPGPNLAYIDRDAPAVAVGTTIYIADYLENGTGFPAFSNLVMHAFDTLTDTFLPTVLGPSSCDNFGAGVAPANSNITSVSAFNDGTLLVTYTHSRITPTTFNFNYVLFSGGFGTPVTISATSAVVFQQIHDPVQDLVYVFYSPNTGTSIIRCLTIQENGTINDSPSFLTSYLATTLPIQQGKVGMPIITNSEIVIPFQYFPFSGSRTLRMARAPLSATPVFTVDTVEDDSTLGGFWPQQWDQLETPGSFALVIAGTLFAFYVVDNGELDSPASQWWLYYRSSTGPGIWSSPEIAYSSQVGFEGLTPYGVANSTLSAAIVLLGNVDPVAGPNDGSWNNVILYLAKVAPPTSVPMTVGGGTPNIIRCCSGGHQFQKARQLEAVRQKIKQQAAWPYVHEFPPQVSIPVQAIAQIPSPALNTVTAVLQYLVPEGFRFYLEAILQDFEGASIDVANALWTIDRDAQIANVQAAPVQGFSQIPIPLGSFAHGKRWELPRAYEFGALTLLRSTVVNQTLGVGLPNSFVSGFFGYLVPTVSAKG